MMRSPLATNCAGRGVVPLLCLFLLLTPGMHGQEPVESLTPEGQFLDLVDLVSSPAKRLPLLDLFLVQFPKYEGIGAIYSQMQADCLALQQFDRTLSIGDKLLAIDLDDIEAVKLNLEAAKGLKNDEAIKKWTARLAELEPVEPTGTVTATSTINTPFVEGNMSSVAGPSPKASGPVSFTKLSKSRLEAVAFNRALAESSTSVRLDLFQNFLREYPQSPHLSKVHYLVYSTYRQAGDDKNALAEAESILAKEKTRDDVIFYVADNYFRNRRELDKVLEYSNLLLAIAENKLAAPEGMSEADWEKQRTLLKLRSHWMIGMVHSYESRWAPAEKELR